MANEPTDGADGFFRRRAASMVEYYNNEVWLKGVLCRIRSDNGINYMAVRGGTEPNDAMVKLLYLASVKYVKAILKLSQIEASSGVGYHPPLLSSGLLPNIYRSSIIVAALMSPALAMVNLLLCELGVFLIWWLVATA